MILLIRRSLSVALSLAVATTASAQSGRVTGRVLDRNSGAPIVGARIDALGNDGRGSTISGQDGRYRLAPLAPGSYTVIATRLGERLRRIEDVAVRAGDSITVDIQMDAAATQLEQVVTSASRHSEKVLDAPAPAFAVTQEAIAARPALTVADHVKAIPGVDVSTGGIVQSNIVTRGFNNAFSTRLLMLRDYRYASVPSLGVNVPVLVPGAMEDVDRIEVVLGPAAALYGPNATDGVLHIITRSPFDSPGTSVTLDGGGRSIARASLRHARILSSRLAFKVSAEEITGTDWQYRDPGEPDSVLHGTEYARRSFDVNRATGEARLDYRPTPSAELITTYGMSRLGSALELTAANGTAQAKGWTYQTIQQRLQWGRLFAQIFANFSDAGNADSLDTRGTFLLRSGQPIVDRSRLVAGSVQHTSDLGPRESLIYGADYLWTNPRTGYTINGRNEDRDNVAEYGGYVHSVTRVAPKWDFVAALRVDHSDRFSGAVYSPRAALVFKPSPSQNLRLTYNRAYSSPSNFEMFLDLVQMRNPGGLPYTIRVIGNPPNEGWSYARTCDPALSGGLCVRSPCPSSLGAPNTLVSADAATYYAAAVAAIASRLPASAQQLVPILEALRPTRADVGGVLRYLTSPTTTVDPASLTSIAPLRPGFVNEAAAGYKAAIGEHLLLSLDLWRQEQVHFTSAAQAATPNLFFEPQSLGRYLAQQIAAALIAQGMPAAQAQATAAAAATDLAAALASVPVATVSMTNARLADRPDIIYTYRNLDGKISYAGLDAEMNLGLSDRWRLDVTYSYVDKGAFPEMETSPGVPLRLNAPQNKGTMTLEYGLAGSGPQVQARMRYSEGFDVNSGVYSTGIVYPTPGVAGGTYTYGSVPTRALIDLSVATPITRTDGRMTWALIGMNLLNSYAPTFVGVPGIGRLLLTRLQYGF